MIPKSPTCYGKTIKFNLLILIYCRQEKRPHGTSLNYGSVGWRKLKLLIKLLNLNILFLLEF